MVAPGRRKGAVRRLRRKGKGRGRTPRPVEKTEEHELLGHPARPIEGII